jgi:hypothetical protein
VSGRFIFVREFHRVSITRSIERWDSARMPASRSKNFRKMAADALRAGRNTQPGDARAAHFDVAASYKSLAHDDEWACGERQRSYKRKRRVKVSVPKG